MMPDIDTIYENNKEDLNYQMYKIASDYWRKRNVFDRWFLGKIENNLDVRRYSIARRSDIFNAWIENVMYFIITRNCVKNWDSKRGTFSTYIYNIIALNEYIFAYQILFNFTQEEAISYARKLKKGKINENNINSRNRRSIICCNLSLNEPINDNEDSYLGDVVEDENNANIQNKIETQEKLKEIFDTLENTKRLTDKQKKIIQSCIKNDCNYAVTARELGYSRQRIEQVMKIFRNLLKNKGIRYDT